MNAPRLHVITAVHNRRTVTEKFVDMLNQQTLRNFRLILVDDGSTDGTSQMVKEKMPDATILHGKGNLWWGGSLQKAYDYLRSTSVDPEDFVLITNDDNNIDPEFLQKGVTLAEKHQKTIVTAVGYSQHNGFPKSVVMDYDLRSGETTDLNPGDSGNCASSRALFFRVRDFLDIGGFHPRLLPHYGSDHEFTIRAWKKGYDIKSFVEFCYTYDDKLTGNRDYSKCSRKELLAKLFSKRSSFNPLYKFTFILLVTPFVHLPSAIYGQATKFLRNCRGAA